MVVRRRVVSAPFIPDAASTLLEAMRTDETEWPEDMEAALTMLPPGHGFAVPDTLFAKISDEEREDWESRFSGVRT